MKSTETTPTPIPENGMTISHEAKYFLQQAGKWASFLGIIGFIFCAVMLLLALSAGTVAGMMAKAFPTMSVTDVAGVVTVYWLIICIVYFFFSLYLYQFGSKIKHGMAFANSAEITGALGKLRSFFKLWGILTIVGLIVVIVATVCGVVFLASMASAASAAK